MVDLKVGDKAYWYNALAGENREVEIIKVKRNRYVVRTLDDGHTYSPLKAMVSQTTVDL